MKLAKLIIDRGSMTMFSDFSLKALIKQWDSKILGPNPFKKVKEHSGHVDLSFDKKTLEECPSAQLQTVGEMAGDGHCNIEAISGTIVYTVDKNAKYNTEQYDIQILTVASSVKLGDSEVKIGNNSGAAGHVLLKYKSGGCLLTSMGHWIELMKIDTSEKVLFDIAAR